MPPGSMTRVSAEGRDVLVANVGGRYLAVDDACTHAGASLSAGALDGCTVRCGLHGAEFDCSTGRLSRFPAKVPDLGTYRAEAESGSVYLEL